MRYTLWDLAALSRTPVGRRRFVTGACYYGWPLLAGPAALHRRTLARDTRVIAVTGSFGKTTTARAIVTALSGHPAPRRVNRNYKGFLALAVLRIRRGQRHRVFEVGLERPGEMEAYARMLRPDIAVVTAIGSDHNRSFPTVEVTRAEKSVLVRALRPSGTAVLNGDDPNVRWMMGQTRGRIMTYGFDASNAVRATEVTLDWPRGMRVRLATPQGAREARVQLVGRPMVYPILAAVAVALEEGIALDQAVGALEALTPTPGRLQPIQLASGATLLRDEFKASRETIEAALDVLGEIPAARRIVVLGEVGEPEGSRGPIYRHLGERVARIASRAIFVAGNYHTAYTAGARGAGLAPDAMLHVKGVGAVVQALREDLGPGTVVLIKGRDSQRLGRIALALMGRDVRCELQACSARIDCDECPMLERGWAGLRAVT